jgi:uncharacterized Zn finger protein (UPF0148 family)
MKREALCPQCGTAWAPAVKEVETGAVICPGCHVSLAVTVDDVVATWSREVEEQKTWRDKPPLL